MKYLIPRYSSNSDLFVIEFLRNEGSMQSLQCLGLQHVNFSISHSSVWSWVTWVNLLLTVTRSTWCVVIIFIYFSLLGFGNFWNQVHYARSWPCLFLIFYSFLNNYDIIVVNCYFLLCNSHVISIACCRLNFCKNRCVIMHQ